MKSKIYINRSELLAFVPTIHGWTLLFKSGAIIENVAHSAIIPINQLIEPSGSAS